MSTQADQIVAEVTAALAADANTHPAEIAEYHDTIPTEKAHEYDLYEGRWTRRVRTVYRCGDGSLFAVERDRGLTSQEYIPPSAEAYRVVSREVTVTEYVRVES